MNFVIKTLYQIEEPVLNAFELLEESDLGLMKNFGEMQRIQKYEKL